MKGEQARRSFNTVASLKLINFLKKYFISIKDISSPGRTGRLNFTQDRRRMTVKSKSVLDLSGLCWSTKST